MYFSELNSLKGIAILLVILGHSFILFPVNLLDVLWCRTAFNIIYSFHMPLFFIVSGLLFANSTHKEYSLVIKSKVKRLVLPYVSYHMLTLGMKVFMPNLVNRKIESLQDFSMEVMLRGGELWFLYVLFLLFIVWGAILPRINKNRNYVLLLVVVLLLGKLTQYIGIGDLFLYKEFLFYSFFFVGGYCCLPYYKQARDFFKLNSNRLIFATLSCFILVHSVLYLYAGGDLKYISALIGILLSLSLALKLGDSNKINSFLNYCGLNSLQFYFFNGFMLVVSRTIVIKLLNVTNSVSIVFGIFILCVMTEFVCIEISKKIPFIRQCVGFK